MNSMGELVLTLIFAFVIIVVATGWSRVSGYISCNSYESITGRSTKYSLITGCYVKNDNDTWVPREEMTKSAVVESK